MLLGELRGRQRPRTTRPRLAVLGYVLLVSVGMNNAGAGLARAQNDLTSLDASAVRSRLVVLRVGDGDDARQVVVLGRPRVAPGFADFHQPARPDMLPREMVRQAVLIAARDELGASTRDEVIDDTQVVDKNAEKGTVEVISFIRDNRSREQIRRVDREHIEALLAHQTPTKPGKNLDLLELLTSAEALSRERFPGVLKGLGVEGTPNAIENDAGLPEQVEDQLTSLGFVEVLLAVRKLHRAIRSDGESLARVGALVRGYALLGVLTEFQWHPAHRAFKARSLLYAQRLIARAPGSPWSSWHRAFALALVGRHREALADLNEAKIKAAGDAKDAPAAPDWVELIDAYARYDSRRLAGREGPQAKLAALLRMLALAYPRLTAVGLQADRNMILLEPHCFRAHDAMCDFFGVSTQHVSTVIGPQALDHFVREKLPAMIELPASVKDRLDGKPPVIEVAELFDKAGASDSDANEPSWGVLGHFLRETRFVQIFRRLYFMKVMLAVPVADYWNEVQQDVAGHRYRPYLEKLALPVRDTAEGFSKFADQVDMADIETTESPMTRSLWNLNRPRAKAAWSIAMAHEDETAEMARSMAEAPEGNKADIAREILKVSPYHPYARSTLLTKDWDSVKDKAAQWEQESSDSPAVLAALGVHYGNIKNYAEAQRVLSRYIELSPDAWAYQSLAATYKEQGNPDRWKETLDEFLKKVEDPGLDHAKVRVEIANYYMGLKQWDKAKPYAEDAAATWAGWAMNCAAKCAEGEQDWQRAEAWYSRETERYPDSSWAVWYFFCKRTGQGNLEARSSVCGAVFDRSRRSARPVERGIRRLLLLAGWTDRQSERGIPQSLRATDVSLRRALPGNDW